ncbi:hypothetical protein IIB79_11565 [candidate division KSB1 bacterium]|nr:hypothetical protein [candidate division KSB1 bacterium]
MKQEIVEDCKEIVREKNIDRDILGEIMENIFMMMIKKKYGEVDNFDVIVNIDKGDIEIYQERIIVETVTDPITEISIEETKKIGNI